MDSSTNITTFVANIAEPNASTPVRVESLPHFYKALIEYATTSCRLFNIQEINEWQEFSADHLDECRNATALELCTIFVRDVLPNIKSYKLEESTKNQLKLLDLHPGFRSVPQGYELVPAKEHQLSEQILLVPQKDFSVTSHVTNTIVMEDSFSLHTPRGLSHTILVESNKPIDQKFGFSKEIAALLSAIVSTDAELSAAQLLEPDIIKARLQSAKQAFAATGNLAPYRPDLIALKTYLQKFVQLRKAIAKVLAKRDF
ncbi:uncharacterized protein LOC115632797 [Scaptodrosophila lebanonensis]|uniref:Uncharacterized protein LOC115632797 n=1 Tax=Drosophila lebanonensis TaxID=7225 RepID=A0A6J2UBZ7_DROLE|nr:uncharacterized protein LOC115632797 [Scaptodrosophila lebanonensis]